MPAHTAASVCVWFEATGRGAGYGGKARGHSKQPRRPAFEVADSWGLKLAALPEGAPRRALASLWAGRRAPPSPASPPISSPRPHPNPPPDFSPTQRSLTGTGPRGAPPCLASAAPPGDLGVRLRWGPRLSARTPSSAHTPWGVAGVGRRQVGDHESLCERPLGAHGLPPSGSSPAGDLLATDPTCFLSEVASRLSPKYLPQLQVPANAARALLLMKSSFILAPRANAFVCERRNPGRPPSSRFLPEGTCRGLPQTGPGPTSCAKGLWWRPRFPGVTPHPSPERGPPSSQPDLGLASESRAPTGPFGPQGLGCGARCASVLRPTGCCRKPQMPLLGPQTGGVGGPGELSWGPGLGSGPRDGELGLTQRVFAGES